MIRRDSEIKLYADDLFSSLQLTLQSTALKDRFDKEFITPEGNYHFCSLFFTNGKE